MKQITTIFLLLIVFLQTFSRYVVETDYMLNKTYIAKVLCINKAKPSLQCKGKCYLSRQLKQQDKQEQRMPTTKKGTLEFQPFFLPEPFYLTTVPDATIKATFPLKNEMNSTTFQPPVFHPPTVEGI